MPNALYKVARLKISLERRGHIFPVQLSLGEFDTEASPYKSRMLLRFAERSIKTEKLDRAYEALMKVILVCSIEDPLIELVSIRRF